MIMKIEILPEKKIQSEIIDGVFEKEINQPNKDIDITVTVKNNLYLLKKPLIDDADIFSFDNYKITIRKFKKI